MPFYASTQPLLSVRFIAVLVIFLLAAHLPLFLNDSIFMDDWLVLKLRPSFPVDIDFLLRGAGHPVFFAYYSIANVMGAPVFVMKIMAIAAILSGAVCLFLVANHTRLLSRIEAVGVAFLVWIYPGYQMWAGKANAVYVFSFGIFFVATWLLALAFGAKGARHALLRIVSALIFFLSFALNSLMVLYAFAMFGLLVAVWRANLGEQGPIRRLGFSVRRCAAGYPEFVVLPLVYWGVLNIWFKRIGAYAGYYGIHLPTLSGLRSGWNAFFQIGCTNVLASAGQTASAHRLPSALIIGGVVMIAFMLRTKDAPPRTSAFHVALPLLLSVLLFFALSMPYLIAGIQPTLHFYETRHLLLFGLPGALLALAFKRLMQGAIGDHAALVGVFGLASIVSMAALWNGYVFLQARALKQEALSSHLAAMPMPPATVLALMDGFEKFSTRFAPFGVAEVSGMLRLAWGDHSFFGFSLQGERPTVLREMEAAWTIEGSPFHSMDPYGPQATILLDPGPTAAPDEVLVRHYYACRLLVTCDVAALLTQLAVVKIEVGPIAGVLPLLHSN